MPRAFMAVPFLMLRDLPPLRLVDTPLIPLLAMQAACVAIRARRLPEARGPRSGQTGNGAPLRLLVLGDSSAAGVGVAHQDMALAGRLVAHLAPHRAVRWRLHARSGATARSTLKSLDTLPPGAYDAAVLALGVNDTKNGLSAGRWRRDYAALLDALATRFGVTLWVASGVPPLDRFPLLPRPLRDVLGRRAMLLDHDLAQLAALRPDVIHLSVGDALDPSAMAEDGFHPGPAVYDAWARRVAQALLDRPLPGVAP